MENKKIIFTDIDGVLNVNYRKKWKKSCIDLYNKITEELNLYPVITSTWRIPHNIDKLNEIFETQGINRKILGATILLQPSIRGLEILEFIERNNVKDYCIIDDNINNITGFVDNIIHINNDYGITENDLIQIRKVFN